MKPDIKLQVIDGDITQIDADVVSFKYARFFHGADKQAAEALSARGVPREALQPAIWQPAIWQHAYVASQGALCASHALFVGVPRLYMLSYGDLRTLATCTLRALAIEAPSARHLAMTIHGPGFGLDEAEACLAQIDGYLDAIRENALPPSLECITIVDRNNRRVVRLLEAVSMRLPTVDGGSRAVHPQRSSSDPGQESPLPLLLLLDRTGMEAEALYPSPMSSSPCRSVHIWTMSSIMVFRLLCTRQASYASAWTTSASR